jgi:hypothetical protein
MVLFCIFNMLDLLQTWYYIDYLHTPNIYETNQFYPVGLLFLKLILCILVILYAFLCSIWKETSVFGNITLGLLTMVLIYVIIHNEWIRYYAVI